MSVIFFYYVLCLEASSKISIQHARLSDGCELPSLLIEKPLHDELAVEASCKDTRTY
ncbi:hypothetical protein KP509_09G098400 [Ceratopteris richardii]|uniref:Uncharacterized protein n=1 Tax=Ceratopteris richardii TaxID=49495 RepID=A0A8T2U793_CERRI|nr:hypothetical protein KP509_09G098400 [Ceratopteris richardii]